MSPLEDVPPQGMRDEQATRGTVAGAGLILQCGLEPSFDLSGDCRDEAWGRKDGDCLWRGTFPPRKMSRQGVGLDVAGTSMIGEGEVETGEEERPPALTGVESFGSADVVFVVRPNQEGQLGALEPVPPLL